MATVSFSFNVNTRINFFYGLSLRQRANAWVNVHFLWKRNGAPGGYEECKKTRKPIASISLHSLLAGIRIWVGSPVRIAVCFQKKNFSTLRWANDEKLAITLIETSDQSKKRQNVNLNFSQSSNQTVPFIFEGVRGVLLFTRNKIGKRDFSNCIES